MWGKRNVGRLEQFTRWTQPNWALGRAMFPMLSRWSRSQSGVIVDYGCGESPFREWFPGARSYVRMDIEPRGRGSVVVGRSLLPARRESVDCVLLFQVLGDVEDPREFLGEIYRALRPGGHVLVFETMSYPEHDLPRDYFRVMPAGLEWVATSVGFRGLEVVRLGGLFTRISQLWNTFLMGRLRSWPLTAWIGVGGTVLMNLAAVALDKVLPHPALASDYLARLEK